MWAVRIPSRVASKGESVKERVVLIGDSIRMGYQEVVRQELAGEAEVWGPEQNGGNSRNVLANLDQWALTRGPAVVHLNCGLHDLRKEFGTGEVAVPPAEYADNVRQILGLVQERLQGTLIWASTTPVNEAWHHQNKGFDRFEADVVAYNDMAAGIARDLGLVIDDLFTVVTDAGRDQLLRDDGVHFTENGYALLGRAVADAVREQWGR